MTEDNKQIRDLETNENPSEQPEQELSLEDMEQVAGGITGRGVRVKRRGA